MWATFWMSEKHDKFKLAMNCSCPHIQVLFGTVQARIQSLEAEHEQEAYNCTVCQNLTVVSLSKLTLLQQPSGRRIKIKFHVFSDSVFMVGRNNSNLAEKTGQSRWRIFGTNQITKRSSICQVKKICWHVYGGAKKHGARTLHHRNRSGEVLKQDPLFLSMFNDFGWRRGIMKSALRNA